MPAGTQSTPDILRDVLIAIRTVHPDLTWDEVLSYVRSMKRRRVEEMAIECGFTLIKSTSSPPVHKSPSPRRANPFAFVLGPPDDKSSLLGTTLRLKPGQSRRRASKGHVSVPRQVTAVGQFSYRGRIYTIGASYRYQLINIIEEDRELIVSLRDGSQKRLTMRSQSEKRTPRSEQQHASSL